MKQFIILLFVLFASGAQASLYIPDGSITNKKVAPKSIQISTGVTTIVENSGIPAPVSGLSVTITTTGRPVMIMLVANTGLFPGGQISCRSTTAKTAIACIGYIYRDGSAIVANSIYTNGASGTLAIGVPPSSIQYVDYPAAGTYTYTYYQSSTLDTVGIANTKLMAFELL